MLVWHTEPHTASGHSSCSFSLGWGKCMPPRRGGMQNAWYQKVSMGEAAPFAAREQAVRARSMPTSRRGLASHSDMAQTSPTGSDPYATSPSMGSVGSRQYVPASSIANAEARTTAAARDIFPEETLRSRSSPQEASERAAPSTKTRSGDPSWDQRGAPSASATSRNSAGSGAAELGVTRASEDWLLPSLAPKWRQTRPPAMASATSRGSSPSSRKMSAREGLSILSPGPSFPGCASRQTPFCLRAQRSILSESLRAR